VNAADREHDRREHDDRIAARVLAWCSFYTRGLPDEVAADRRDELASDLHEQLADASARGDRRVGRAIARRAILGAVADLSWRAKERGLASRSAMPVTMSRDRAATVRLVVACYILGSGMASAGIVAAFRTAVHSEYFDSANNLGWPFALGAVVAFAAMVMLARPHGRAWGAALLALCAAWMWCFFLSGLPTLSATVSHYLERVVVRLGFLGGVDGFGMLRGVTAVLLPGALVAAFFVVVAIAFRRTGRLAKAVAPGAPSTCR
jgi:hypothetical protein